MIYVVKSHTGFEFFNREAELNDYITTLIEMYKFNYDYDHRVNCPENCVCNSIDIEDTIKTVYEKGIRVTNLRKEAIYVTLENEPYLILKGEDQRTYILATQDDFKILHSESLANEYIKMFTSKHTFERINGSDINKINKIYIADCTDDHVISNSEIKLNISVSFNEMVKFTNKDQTLYVFITDLNYCEKECSCDKDITHEELSKILTNHKKNLKLPMNIYISLSEFKTIAQHHGHMI
jgi:hypothetical protein